jgi:hypothetical protein
MSLYAADGSWNVTVVDGSTFTGLYAPDGSYNVVEVDGTSIAGLYAPCGAYNVFVSDGTYTGFYHPSGAINVSVSPYELSTVRVTAVSGDLGNDPLAPGALTEISWTENPTADTTPGFSVNLPSGNGAPLDAAADDHLIGEYQENGTGSWIEWLDYTLTGTDIIDDTISVSGVDALPAGTHTARFRLERGVHIGPNTSADNITIASASTGWNVNFWWR